MSASSSPIPIVVGADHGGFELGQSIAAFLREKGHSVEVFGPTKVGEKAEYPDVVKDVCEIVQDSNGEKRGILVCGTGIGMSMAANKYAGIRCALCHEHYTGRMCREHNDANVLALGGRVVGPEVALEIVTAFITTEFAGAHHTARLAKLGKLDKSCWIALARTWFLSGTHLRRTADEEPVARPTVIRIVRSPF